MKESNMKRKIQKILKKEKKKVKEQEEFKVRSLTLVPS